MAVQGTEKLQNLAKELKSNRGQLKEEVKMKWCAIKDLEEQSLLYPSTENLNLIEQCWRRDDLEEDLHLPLEQLEMT